MSFYDILQVPVNATREDICKSFRALALLHHPDKTHADPKQFQAITKAYETLSDKDKRWRYDQVLFDDEQRHEVFLAIAHPQLPRSAMLRRDHLQALLSLPLNVVENPVEEDVPVHIHLACDGNCILPNLEPIPLFLEAYKQAICKPCAIRWLQTRSTTLTDLFVNVFNETQNAVYDLMLFLSKSTDDYSALLVNESFLALRKRVIDVDCTRKPEICLTQPSNCPNDKPGMVFLFATHKKLKKRYEQCMTSKDLRELAFFAADYADACVTVSPVTVFNQLILTCFLLYEARDKETDVGYKYADEELLLQICAQMMLTMPQHLPFVEFYVMSQLLRLMHHMQYKHAVRPLLTFCAQKRILELSKLPLMPPGHLCSNIDLITMNVQQSQFLKRCLKPKRLDDQLLLYNVCALGGEAKRENLSHIRFEMIKTYLAEQGFSLLHMSRNIHSEWNTVNQAKDGYWQFGLNASLPFDPRLKAYTRLKGFEIKPNGSVDLVLEEFDANKHEAWQKAFTDLDVEQIWNHNITQSSFSLDPVSGEYKRLPLQKMVFQPPELRDTEYLFAQFAADYWLKALRQGTNVQMEPPYNMKPLDFAQLPTGLEDIMRNYHSCKNKSSASRVWIESSDVPCLQEGQRFTLGDPRMIIDSRTMTWVKGELKDCDNQDEGWHVFVFKDANRPLVPKTSRAIVFHTSNHCVSFVQDGKPSALARKVELTKPLYDSITKYDGKVPLNEQTRSLLYDFVIYVCKALGKPHHYSPDRVLVAQLTQYYDEFAKVFPVWNRLKQLTKLVAMMRHVQNKKTSNANTKIKYCDLVPAIHNSDDHGHFVCGGVRLMPTLSCRMSTDYYCRQLTYPSAACDFKTRCEAEQLMGKLKRSIGHDSLGCDTSAVKSLVFDLDMSLRSSSLLHDSRSQQYWKSYDHDTMDHVNDYEITKHKSTQMQYRLQQDQFEKQKEEYDSMHDFIASLDVIPAVSSSIVQKTFPYLYRGDQGSMEELFAKGRQAVGINTNLYEHHAGYGDSAYVSTSTSAKVACGFPDGRPTTLYQICSSRKGVDMNPLVSKWHSQGKYVHLGEHEIAFQNNILPHEIKGAWQTQVDGMNIRRPASAFIQNPAFQDPAGVARLVSNANAIVAKGLTVVGVVVDATSLYDEIKISRTTGDYTNTKAEMARIAGGWSAGIASSAAFAKMGEMGAGSNLVAKVVCGAAMGIVGGYLGYKHGSEAALDIFYESMDGLLLFQKSNDDYQMWQKPTADMDWEMLKF